MEFESGPEYVRSEFTSRFGGRRPLLYQAPGRINIIGEHTDYNDGFVLPTTVDLYTWAAISPREDRILRVHAGADGRTVSIDLDRIEAGEKGDWPEYIKGVAWSLAREGSQLHGADLVFAGNIPLGGGLSSSASLEVLLAYALLDCSEIDLERRKIALACQRAEAEFVGVQCGIMDQYAITCGSRDHALMLDCRSQDFERVGLPGQAAFLLVHSGIRHQLAAGSYNSRRNECRQAVEILASVMPGLESLRDLEMDQLENHRKLLTDQLFRRCRHVVTENLRVVAARDALESAKVSRLGKLMSASHNSLRDDFEVSCPELDLLVDIADECEGLWGSRMMGGGFGGCTISLVDADMAEQVAKTIKARYGRKSGREPWLHIVGPADGVCRINGLRPSGIETAAN
jgi:galactokinase